MQTSDVLIVAFEHDENDDDLSALVVSRKDIGGDIKIINAILGRDAKLIYKQLTKMCSG